ncbi:MAG: four-helix bundle copper-binding protein [Caulobacteraceae bacterium]|nr:four-helix bundle copper-binding protein [Caulobacteraceae bacterium]
MHPQPTAATPSVADNTDRHDDPLTLAVEAAAGCAQAATAAADACAAQGDRTLTQAIRLTLDCADVCRAAASVGARRSGSNAPVVIGLLMLAEALCRDCAAECDQHVERLAALARAGDACRRTADACLDARTAVAREQLQ